jgi:hypothetical protein
MRYVILDPTGVVCGVVFGPGAGWTPPSDPNNQVVQSDTANVGDVYADGVFTTPGDAG